MTTITSRRQRHQPNKSDYSTPGRSNGVYLVLFMLLAGGFLLWFLPASYAVEREYSDISATLKSAEPYVVSVKIGSNTLHVPSWSYFSKGNIWNLVSKSHGLPETFIPELVTSPVAHTSGDLQVASSIAPKLSSLFNVAKNSGINLMLSSAYRSASDQQEVYDGYLRLYGQSYVNSYVALPGTSEHQTGLAVDIATADKGCERSANDCSLDGTAIVWLNQHAQEFGFIQRYPSGKQSITGISGEAWHYRYVGTELAELLAESNSTLDEFVQQVAPGYAH